MSYSVLSTVSYTSTSSYSYSDTRSFIATTTTSSAAAATSSASSSSSTSRTNTIIGIVLTGLFVLAVFSCWLCVRCGPSAMVRRLRRSEQREEAQMRQMIDNLGINRDFVTPFSTSRAPFDDRPCEHCTRNVYMNLVQAVMRVGDGQRHTFTCPIHGRPADSLGAGGSGYRASSGPDSGYPHAGDGGAQQMDSADLEQNFQSRITVVRAELANLASMRSNPDLYNDTATIASRELALQRELGVLQASLANITDSRRIGTRRGGAGAGAYGRAEAGLGPLEPAGIPAQQMRATGAMAPAGSTYRDARDPEAGTVDAPPAYSSVLGHGDEGVVVATSIESAPARASAQAGGARTAATSIDTRCEGTMAGGLSAGAKGASGANAQQSAHSP